MNNYKKFEFIAAQFFAGLVFAIPGAILISLVHGTINELRDIHVELFDSFLFVYIGAYFGMLIGIWFISYSLLKEMGLKIKFLIHALQSIGGLSFGLIFPYIIAISLDSAGWKTNLIKIPNVIMMLLSMNILIAFIPLIATMLGFNFRLFKNTTNSELKNNLL